MRIEIIHEYQTVPIRFNLSAYQTACFPCFYGNYLSSSTGQSIGTITAVLDSINNVEEIIIPANTYATGTVITALVTAQNLTADGVHPGGGVHEQDFALYVDNAH